MIRRNSHQFAKSHMLVSVALLAIGLVASTAVPALAQTSGTWATTGSMKTARCCQTATLLQNGQVLVAGGFNGNVLASAQLYNTSTGRWSATGSLKVARNGGTATLLNNGQVLVVGGSDAAINSIADAELYNPATGQWTVTGSLSTARDAHTATLLSNGQVLVAGGLNISGSSSVILSSAELYDPATGKWTRAASMSVAREQHTATLLNNGQVLVAAGFGVIGVPGQPEGSLSSAELYDPSKGQWTATGSLNTARYGHAAVLLANGEPLVLDGVDQGSAGTFNLQSTELYNPSTGKWTLNGNTFQSGNGGFSVTMLNTGKVLIAGGIVGVYPHTFVTAAAELYDPSTGTSASTGSLNTARETHTATLLQNGQVLAAGGENVVNSKTNYLSSAELYTP